MMATVRNARELYNLDCALCHQPFKNSRVLPCLHSFCQTCLQDKTSGQERILICSICNTDIPIPTKGVDAFPSNSFANNMLNILAVQGPTRCTNCEDRELASSRCLDCVENLCENCVTAHERIRQTKTHKIISFEELQNNDIHDAVKCPSFCKVHDREMLKYFCETCDDTICRDCAIYEHREHHYYDLKEAVKLHRGRVAELLDASKRKIPSIRLALKEVLEVAENLKQRKALVTGFINNSIEHHIKRLEDKRLGLIEKLQNIFIDKEAVLKEQQMNLEMDLSNLSTSSEFVENVMTFGNEAEIMMVKRLICARLEQINQAEAQLEPEENDIIEFFPEDHSLQVAIENFGIVSTSDTFPPNCIALGVGLHEAKLGQWTSFRLVTKNRLEKLVTKGGDYVVARLTDAQGLTTSAEISDNDDGTYRISYKVTNKDMFILWVYVREKPIQGSPFTVNVTAGMACERIGPVLTQFGSGGVLSSVKNDDTYEPWGVVCDKDGSMIVSDHNNHKIQTFDLNGKLISQFGSRGKNEGEVWYPAGVAIDNKGDIFVADHGNHRIQIFSKDGKFLKAFGSRGNGGSQLKAPCGIAVDLKNRLVVTDRDNHRVQVFDIQGNFMFLFGAYGSADGKFNSPRHVAITNENHILISDTNNYRVQRFDQNGNFLSKFGSKGALEGQFMCPSGISTDCENNIAVVDFKNLNIQIFNSNQNLIKVVDSKDDNTTRQLSKPTGICVTHLGNVLVTDRGTHKIHMY